MIKVNFELCHEDAICPYRAHRGDIGYDVFPAFDEDYIEIKPGETKLIPTGIKSNFSEKYGVIFKERSGLGSKGIKVSAGVIDSIYLGEWHVAFYNTKEKPVIIAKYLEDWSEEEAYTIDYSNAITQAVFVDAYQIEPNIVDDIEQYETIRGTKGFGSTDT